MPEFIEFTPNFSLLSNKKTSSKEKLDLFATIDLTSYDSKKLNMILPILTSTGDKIIEVRIEAYKTLFDIVSSINPYLIKQTIDRLLNGFDDGTNINVKLSTIIFFFVTSKRLFVL